MTTQGSEGIFREMGFPPQRAWWPGAVVYSVARTYSLLVRELERVYARFGLSAPSFNLLMLLKHGAEAEAMTQQAIGKRLVVSPSDMTGLIDRLERRGFVQRTRGQDRRCKLLRITPKGKRLTDEVWPHHVQTVTRLTQALNARQAQALVQDLGRLRSALT